MSRFSLRFYLTISILFSLLCGMSACKSLDTTVSVPTRALPQSFSPPLTTQTNLVNLATDTTTIAALAWREYFQDSLLVALIDTTLRNNFDVRIALQRIELAGANVQFAKGELFPKVQASIGAGARRFGLYTMDGAGNATTDITPGRLVPVDLPDLSVGVQTTWEADIWGKLRNRSDAAAAQYLASVEGTRFLTTALIAELASTYYELLALDTELEILRRTLQKQQEALSVIQLQKSAGRANELAVQQFEAQVLNTQALEQETLQQITLQENRINFLAGRYPQPIARRTESLLAALPERISSGIPSQLLGNRPDVREAEYLVQASKFELEAAKASFFPTLSLSAGIGFQAFDPQFLFLSPASIAYNALGGLVAPLVNWQGLEAQFSAAKSQQIQALYQYQKSIVNGYVEAVNELSMIERLRGIADLKTRQRNTLEKSVETATDLYKNAKATYLEVLLTQQNSLQSQLDLVSVQKRQRLALVNLYKALGGGWR
jgi:outer membrane protein, multidrug efflux system